MTLKTTKFSNSVYLLMIEAQRLKLVHKSHRIFQILFRLPSIGRPGKINSILIKCENIFLFSDNNNGNQLRFFNIFPVNLLCPAVPFHQVLNTAVDLPSVPNVFDHVFDFHVTHFSQRFRKLIQLQTIKTILIQMQLIFI